MPPTVPSGPPFSGRHDVCGRLLQLAERMDGLTDREWWVVDLVCRQNLSLDAVADRLGIRSDEVERLWSALVRLAR